MKKNITSLIFTIVLTFSFCACTNQETKHCNTDLGFYPESHNVKPEILSPCLTEDGIEILVIQTKDNKYALVPVTVENGQARNYPDGQWGKGMQLELGCSDFPTLAKTGLHSERELLTTKTITGIAVDKISEEARPGHSSFEGFIAEDEDIISVLNFDNQLVRQLGFKHADVARPLFQIVNLILEHRIHFVGNARVFDDVKTVYFNGHDLNVTWGGDKGFQTSIFNDDNLGYYWIKIHRKLSGEELNYLKKQYADLSESQFQLMIEKLSGFNTGEMVPYYIMNYGFYEGHTGYRADPITIAMIFGLKTLPEIDKALKHEIPHYLRI